MFAGTSPSAALPFPQHTSFGSLNCGTHQSRTSICKIFSYFDGLGHCPSAETFFNSIIVGALCQQLLPCMGDFTDIFS